MIKVENLKCFNLEGAMYGMRNPLESWSKSDSHYNENGEYIIGASDIELAWKLILSGSDHRKFMRQIFVSVDITAPMGWWWDMDTYKVSTTKNSSSRMHKLATRRLYPRDFSWDFMNEHRWKTLRYINNLISSYQAAKEFKNDSLAKEIYREILQDLPESYNFKAHWTGTYEVLRNVFQAREFHKQLEFREFCVKIKELPHSEFITMK